MTLAVGVDRTRRGTVRTCVEFEAVRDRAEMRQGANASLTPQISRSNPAPARTRCAA